MSDQTTTVRSILIVRCLHCKHVWDEHDPNSEFCPCIDLRGFRTVEVLSEGATNLPTSWLLGEPPA